MKAHESPSFGVLGLLDARWELRIEPPPQRRIGTGAFGPMRALAVSKLDHRAPHRDARLSRFSSIYRALGVNLRNTNSCTRLVAVRSAVSISRLLNVKPTPRFEAG